ncbi:MAG: DUF4160 domain-containing protein [Chlamydiia bacterium]|nr:DUF4160 domain-containing protein [Chlamydiia bacterium]
MPEICRFLSIIIKMYYDDHAPPHFHAEYQGNRAMFSIATGMKIKGRFPKKQEVLVRAWAVLRKKELLKAWESAVSEQPPRKIAPLE